MALQVWLQLNGNLKNTGLNNGVSASSTVACQGSGSPIKKVGCYFFTTGQSITFTGIDFSNLSKASISFWAYQDSKKNTIFFTGQGTNYYLGASSGTGTSNFYHGQVNGTKKSYVDGVAGTKLGSAGAWHHYVFTDVDLSTWKQLKFNNYSSAYNFAGRVFDIRIYDHVLCDDDVKRLYQLKMFELVPYEGVKNILFDKSGFMIIPMVNSGAVFNANSLYFNGGASTRLRPQKGNVGFDIPKFNKTLSIWFNPVVEPSDSRILVIDSTSNMAVGFDYISNHNIYLLLTSNYNSKTFNSSLINYGELNNIIVGYSGQTPQYCIVNGVSATIGGETTSWSDSRGLTIGGRLYNNISNFNGIIYKVGVFSNFLTSTEAIELYNLEKGMFLPDDYIQLEYIQSTGTQWIDVGVKANQNTKAEIKFEITGNATGYNAVFGSRTSYTSNAFNVWSKCGNGNIGANYCKAGAINSTIAQAANVTYHITLEKNKLSVIYR